MKQKLTIFMTGAHITPAVALTQSIRKKAPTTRVVYAGRANKAMEFPSIEQTEIERVGGHFRTITSGKLHRFFTWSQLVELGKFPIGLGQAVKLLWKEKPDIIVSFGGYLSIPIVIAGKFLGIPIVIHEQTTVWGLANRICRKWANAVAVSWPHLEEPGVFLTGNPIPEEIIFAGKHFLSTEGRNVLYITEGSQASKTISHTIRNIIGELLERFEVYHQTKYPATEITSLRYHTSPWFSTPQHAKILQKTSVAVSRAGANTITYLAYAGIPSLLIPLPHAGGNEQMENAKMLASTGLGRILPQSELSAQRLLSEIMKLFSQSERLIQENRVKARGLVKVDAASILADLVFSTIHVR